MEFSFFDFETKMGFDQNSEEVAHYHSFAKITQETIMNHYESEVKENKVLKVSVFIKKLTTIADYNDSANKT